MLIVTMAILTAEFMPISVWLRLRSAAVSHSLMESSIFAKKFSEPLITITVLNNNSLSVIIAHFFRNDNIIIEKRKCFLSES